MADKIFIWGLCVLVTYRLSYEFAVQDGFFAIFRRLRTVIAEKFPYESKNAWITEIVHCPVCWSLFVAAIIIAVFFTPFIKNIQDYLLYWLATSGGVLVLHWRGER